MYFSPISIYLKSQSQLRLLLTRIYKLLKLDYKALLSDIASRADVSFGSIATLAKLVSPLTGRMYFNNGKNK